MRITSTRTRNRVSRLRASLAGLILSFVLLGVVVTSGTEATPASADPETSAVWQVGAPGDVNADSSTIAVLVTRVACNSGVTGTVDTPTVSIETDRIVVSFTVSPPVSGPATCQSNDWVPFDLDLGQPIGARVLVDGACLPGGSATGTSFCSADGVRWPVPLAGPDPEESPPANAVEDTPSYTG